MASIYSHIYVSGVCAQTIMVSHGCNMHTTCLVLLHLSRTPHTATALAIHTSPNGAGMRCAYNKSIQLAFLSRQTDTHKHTLKTAQNKQTNKQCPMRGELLCIQSRKQRSHNHHNSSIHQSAEFGVEMRRKQK